MTTRRRPSFRSGRGCPRLARGSLTLAATSPANLPSPKMPTACPWEFHVRCWGQARLQHRDVTIPRASRGHSPAHARRASCSDQRKHPTDKPWAFPSGPADSLCSRVRAQRGVLPPRLRSSRPSSRGPPALDRRRSEESKVPATISTVLLHLCDPSPACLDGERVLSARSSTGFPHPSLPQPAAAGGRLGKERGYRCNRDLADKTRSPRYEQQGALGALFQSSGASSTLDGTLEERGLPSLLGIWTKLTAKSRIA